MSERLLNELAEIENKIKLTVIEVASAGPGDAANIWNSQSGSALVERAIAIKAELAILKAGPRAS